MKAIITGITGQDGSYLAEFLLSRGYEVHGLIRHSSGNRCERIDHILDRLHLHQADLLDDQAIVNLVEQVRPEEIYNLAGLMTPSEGWTESLMCSRINAIGVTRLLEAIRLVDPSIRLFQASTADMFGRIEKSPQTETTPFRPLTPYGVTKLYAHWMAVNYREKYGLKTCCGILYDHESPRRGLDFVTRRITHAAALIKLGLKDRLTLDHLDMHRDWGFAGDYVRSFWMMLQNDSPDDYVIATGTTHSLEEFCRLAFTAADLDWRDHVHIRNAFNKGIQSPPLTGDNSHARKKLLWEPEVSFEDMITMMVETDLDRYSLRGRMESTGKTTQSWQRSLV
ncbi:MAG: GDP-mannose 4,6-dehydratase [FCB group bacterium]|nr:GDP-mannose 4,6-dehydratase [FCB group bacterium]